MTKFVYFKIVDTYKEKKAKIIVYFFTEKIQKFIDKTQKVMFGFEKNTNVAVYGIPTGYNNTFTYIFIENNQYMYM